MPMDRGRRMRVDIVTIFPEAFAPLDLSILRRARERGLLEVVVWDLREFTTDRHRQGGDSPFGRGGGLGRKPGAFFGGRGAIRGGGPRAAPRVHLTAPPGGRPSPALATRVARAARPVLP